MMDELIVVDKKRWRTATYTKIKSVSNIPQIVQYIQGPPGSGATPISARRRMRFFSGGLRFFGSGPFPGIAVHSKRR